MVTLITLVVEPFDHVIVPVVHPLAVKLAVSLPQIVVLFEVITGADGLSPFLISITFDALLTPHRFSHVALYVPATLATNVLPVAPVLHLIVPFVQPLAVKLAVSLPQIVSLFVEIVGVLGFVLVLIMIASDD